MAQIKQQSKIPEQIEKEVENQEKSGSPKKEVKKEPKRVEYVTIDTFLETAKVIYHLSSMEVAGFKGYMSGRHYQKKDVDFVPFLKKYLGRGDI